MIPYSTQDAIKVTDLVNATNVNETRYELLSNDLSLSAQFEGVLSGFSCFDAVTSVYSTVASHSGIWNDALVLSNLDILVRTNNLTTPSTNTIIPVWNADEAKHLDPIWHGSTGRALTADYLTAPTKAELDNPALNWAYRIPSMQVVRAMINSTEYGTGGKTWCAQEYNMTLYPATNGVLSAYRNEVCLWKDDVPGHNVIGKENTNTLMLTGVPTHGWAVGVGTYLDTDPVVATDVGQFCYCVPIVPPYCIYDNALSAKTMYLQYHDNTPDINSNFSLVTFASRMELTIDSAGLKSKLANPMVVLAAYNGATEYDDITTVATWLSINKYYNNYTGKTVNINSSMSYFPYEAKDVNGNLTLEIGCVGIGGTGKTFSQWTIITGTGVTIGNVHAATTTMTFNMNSNSKVKIGAIFT